MNPTPVQNHSPALQKRLQAALLSKGMDYHPRTEHLLKDGSPEYTNRLILEDSPYLLQHAHNPVDWYPWGAEAFEKAKSENKPVFLSIGYSTCHWCHVMERESFDTLEIARLLNAYFIPIKVDRERRPDVDATYMTAVMLIAGNGGWPMSTFLSPEGKPFFGGTYFPAGQFAHLLEEIHTLWNTRGEDLRDQAERVTGMVGRIMANKGEAGRVDSEVIRNAVSEIMATHDKVRGGFGEAPKFPNEPVLLLLLENAERRNDRAALEAVEDTLDAMARGGIYDQLGGGFHRYATDSAWQIPHFEKMLYNQAQLARAYIMAWRLTGKTPYLYTARQTIDYALRDMQSREGGFYSATDADSAGEEGAFFLWTPAQINQTLASRDAELAIELFGITEEGNFEGRNILHLPLSLAAYAAKHHISLNDLHQKTDRLREQLRLAREQRTHPFRDEKIVTAWNGMMITTLSMAAGLLGETRYLEAAERTADFLWNHHHPSRGRLWRVSLHGKANVPATLEDYAYFAEGLVQLYDLTAEQRWLKRAREIADGMLDAFWDKEYGGFYMTATGGLIVAMSRPRDGADNAIPSGNSVALRVLAMLARRTNQPDYDKKAQATLASFSSSILRQPAAFTYLLMGADTLLHGELGERQYGAHGAVQVNARLNRDAQDRTWLNVDLDIATGWHINAHHPLEKNLIPTTVGFAENAHGWRLGPVAYPEPEVLKLGFQQEPLALYRDTVHLRAPLKETGGATTQGVLTIPIQLHLQACSARFCLPPEDMVLHVSPHLGVDGKPTT